MWRRASGRCPRRTTTPSAGGGTSPKQLSVGRSFRVRERVSFQVRAEFFNAFNRLLLPNPGQGAFNAANPRATPQFNAQGAPTSGFGFISNATNIGGQRNGQLVARFEF